MAFFPECKDSREPTLASRKRRPNKNNMRTNQQGSSPNQIFAKLWKKVTNKLGLYWANLSSSWDWTLIQLI